MFICIQMFLIWIEGLNMKVVRCRMVCKVLWGKLVVLGSVNQTYFELIFILYVRVLDSDSGTFEIYKPCLSAGKAWFAIGWFVYKRITDCLCPQCRSSWRCRRGRSWWRRSTSVSAAPPPARCTETWVPLFWSWCWSSRTLLCSGCLPPPSSLPVSGVTDCARG